MIIIFTAWQGPSGRDYFKMARMSIRSLIWSGFNSANIICIGSDEAFLDSLDIYGIKTIHYTLPPTHPFMTLIKSNPRKAFLYKPAALFHGIPKPLDNIMLFSDVDALFHGNPTDIIRDRLRDHDVWSAEYIRIPRPRRDKKPRMNNPALNLADLTRFYARAGSSMMANCHLKYKWPLQNRMLCAGNVAITSDTYERLISLWYETCIEHVESPHFKGDQEMLTVAVWRLGIKYTSDLKNRVARFFCKQYPEKDRQMIKDFRRMKKNRKLAEIRRRNKRKKNRR